MKLNNTLGTNTLHFYIFFLIIYTFFLNQLEYGRTKGDEVAHGVKKVFQSHGVRYVNNTYISRCDRFHKVAFYSVLDMLANHPEGQQFLDAIDPKVIEEAVYASFRINVACVKL